MLVSVAMSGLGAVGGWVWVCVWGGGGVRGQLPAGGIRASQGTFSSLDILSPLEITNGCILRNRSISIHLIFVWRRVM